MLFDIRSIENGFKIWTLRADKKLLFNHVVLSEPKLSPISRKMVKVVLYHPKNL